MKTAWGALRSGVSALWPMPLRGLLVALLLGACGLLLGALGLLGLSAWLLIRLVS